MKKPLAFVALTVFLALAGSALVALVEAADGTHRTPPPKAPRQTTQPRKTAVEYYAVVRVDDELKVVMKSEVAALRKKAADDYLAAVKEYNEAKKAAAQEKRKVDVPKPTKPRLAIVRSSFKTQEAAEAFLEKLLAEKEETPAGKGPRTGPKTKQPPEPTEEEEDVRP